MAGTLPEKIILEVQEGGSGANPWSPLHLYDNISGAIMSAPSGGGVQFTPFYGRNYAKGAQLEPVGLTESGQPAPFTFNLELTFEARKYLQTLFGKKNVRARWYSGEYGTPSNYEKMLYWVNVRNTDRGYNRNIVDNTTNPGDQLRRTLGQYALFEVELDRVVHVDISGAVTTLAINDIINVGYPRPAGGGPGENTNLTGDEEFVFCTDRGGIGLPAKAVFTTDKGATWTARDLTGFNEFDAIAVVKAGPNLVFASNNASMGGVIYVNYQNFKDNSYTVVRASGSIGATTVINDIIAVSNSLLYACGNAGAVYKSTDGGLTWASAGTAVTANNLLTAEYADENLIWFGGASGTLVKLYNGAMSVVTVTGLGTTAINTLAVPRGPFGRSVELYVGDAAGNIRRTLNSLASAPSFSALSFDSSGAGAIEDIKFVGPDGVLMYFLQTNGSLQTRVIRDLSGGKGGQDCHILGGFTSPANAVINAIAPSSENYALTVGEVEGGQGFIGQVA